MTSNTEKYKFFKKEYSPQHILEQKNHLIREFLIRENDSIDLLRKKTDPISQGFLFTLDNYNFQEAWDDIKIIEGEGKTIQIYGSRDEDETEFQRIRNLSCSLFRQKIAKYIAHGGSGGIMKAAGKGAIEGGGVSVGYALWNDIYTNSEKAITFESKGMGINHYVNYIIRFAVFHNRIRAMFLHADAIIASAKMGIGTIAELSDNLVEIQAGAKKPIIIFGDTKSAQSFKEMLNHMLNEKSISEKNKEIILIETQNEENILSYLKNNFKLTA